MIEHWVTASKLAEITGKHKTTIRRRADKEKWVKRMFTDNGGKQYRYRLADLPEDVQFAYAVSMKTTLDGLRAQLAVPEPTPQKVNIPRYSGRGAKTRQAPPMEKVPEEYLKVAAMRRKVIEAWNASGLTVEQFVTAYQNGVAVPDLRDRLDKYGDINTYQSFYRWLADYREHGLAGLAPRYPKKRGGNGAGLDQQAKELIEALYLDDHQPSARSVERSLVQFGYDVNYHTIWRYLKTEVPASVKTFYRLGEKTYHDRFDPYVPRDFTLLKTMEWGVADHHLFDFVVTHEGRIMRPWLTRFDDVRSRYITGWHIDVVPNTLTVLRALDNSLQACGAFEHLLIDNGKDFKSLWLSGTVWKQRRMKIDAETAELVEGVFQDCGMTVHFCNPYRGQSKPIERAFRTDIELFEKNIETYVGSNTAMRPDEAKLYWGKINGRDKVPVLLTLDELRERYAEYVLWYNTQWKHSGQGMDGKTPKQVFEENWTVRRIIPDERRKFIFTRRDKRTVQRNGVTIDGIDYYAPEMVQYIGSDVQVRRDINEVGKVHIFKLPELTYLFDAYSDVLKDGGVTEENVRAQKKAQKDARKHLDNYAKNASEIKKLAKTPAELLAAEHVDTKFDPPEEQIIQVVNGGPILPDEHGKPQQGGRILELYESKPQKRKLKGIFDTD